MRYTVTAFEMIDTVGGLLENVAEQQSVTTSGQAEKLAKEWTETGKYSSIYISYRHRDSSCYWNPAVGFEVVGKDWLSHFEEQGGNQE
ncbi:hypothetical protein NDK47_27590 (plasmid) [Brevibacillus ruminantium]|uniref:Uncharacterized protein n=1 Tax=Brevibacillus ruminantium TaxID=2950604 RepID=A0ABY4WP64_9BACL|nr:hypothetical protein [Brevibacillus ruminantium]USG68551.1 hypothetical protein NDK47_27590 [Brevibacillus ruminantium]